MEYSEIIHEFIDGTLDPSREEELFMLLGRNEDYRTDFKQQFAIKTTVKSDKLAFTPAPESTMKLFSSLGFTPPPAPIPGTAVGSVSILRRLSGIAQGFKGALAATAVCTAVFLAMLQTGNLSFNKTRDLTGNSASLSNNSNINKGNIIDKNLQPIQNESKLADSPKEKIVYKYIYLKSKSQEKSPVNQDQALTNNNTVAVQNLPLMIPAENQVRKIISDLKPIIINNPGISIIAPINNYSPIALKPNHFNVSLEIRGSQDYYLSKANITPYEFQKYNNMVILAQYQLSDEFSLGLEYRRENFYQKYTGIKDNKLFDYEQQPNFETVGLSARYLFTPLQYSYLTPFFGASAGFNRAGVVARGIGGIEFTPVSGYSLILGGEYSNLWFQHVNNYFNSGKFSLQFGTRVNF